MRRTLVTLFAGVLVASSAFAQQDQKRRVAVLDFGYGTVMTSVQSLFGTNQDVGKGISDLLIDKLANGGTYRVIERQALDKILKEQNFSNSDRADSSTAAKIGRLLGADTIIVGDITQFGRDDRNTNVGSIVNRWDKYGLGKVGVKKAKAVVAITARMVDVNTAEVLASVSGRGESNRSGTDLLGAGGGWGGGGGGSLDMGSSNFSQTILGEAVGSAVTQVASQLQQNASR
ncbi:MAG: CsgG/HfaB family protein, partial [Candidatus Sulfotelmatobacter sp.]